MNVLIVRTVAKIGGVSCVDSLHKTLVEQLKQAGYQVDTALLPFVHDSRNLVEQILAFRLLNLSDYADRMIGLDFPAGFVKHPRKFLIVSSESEQRLSVEIGHSVSSLHPVAARVRHAERVALKECKSILCEQADAYEGLAQSYPAIQSSLLRLDYGRLIAMLAESTEKNVELLPA